MVNEKCIELITVSRKEWRVINAIIDSWSIREIARKTKLPFATVYRIVKNFISKGRIRFIPDYKAMGLLPTYIISVQDDIEEAPVFTRAVRRMWGYKPLLLISALLPEPFLDRYIRSLNLDVIKVIKGYDYIRWRPDLGGTLYSPSTNRLFPVFSSIIDNYRVYSEPVKRWRFEGEAPDREDLIIIWGRLKNPFMGASEAVSLARKVDPSIPPLSKQVLSYHLKRHVRKLWLYNSVTLYLDVGINPIRVFYIEGSEAHVIARGLVSLPSFFSAAIDEDKAIVVGQPPNHMFPNIYKMISSMDVELPLGDLILEQQNMVVYFEPLWRYARDGKWVWLEKKVPVARSR